MFESFRRPGQKRSVASPPTVAKKSAAEPAAKRQRVTQAVKLEYEAAPPAPAATNGVGEDVKGPLHWKEHYENIAEMRKNRDAPVDTMGCAALADPGAEPRVQRFQTLVALMLSSQTKVCLFSGV